MDFRQPSQSDNIQLNIAQTKCVIFLAMLYVSTMLCNAILTNKWIAIGDYFVFGGAFVSPLLFILGDVIAEIFGYKIAKQIIIFGFVCQTLFAFMIEIMLSTPAPLNWHEQGAFNYVLGSLIRINFSGLAAFITSSLINIHFITRWKILLMGRYFWLRSLGSSTIAEACYSALAIVMIAFGSLPFSTMIGIIVITTLIKFLYSIVFAYPGSILVGFIKTRFNIDVYDLKSDEMFLFRKDIKNSNKKTIDYHDKQPSVS